MPGTQSRMQPCSQVGARDEDITDAKQQSQASVSVLLEIDFHTRRCAQSSSSVNGTLLAKLQNDFFIVIQNC